MHNWARSKFCFAIYNVQLGEALLGENLLTDDPLHHPGSWIPGLVTPTSSYLEFLPPRTR